MADEKKVDQSEEKPVFTWKAAEFETHQKGIGWFATVIFGALLLVILFAINKNWTAAGVVFAAGLAFVSLARTNPKKIKCSLYHSGILIENKAYRFSDLKSFWVIYGDHPRVRFAQPGKLSAHINMPISDEDPEQIRLFISKYLPEQEDRGEDFSDIFSRWIKF